MAATVSVSRSQFQAVAFAGFRARLVDVLPAASDYPTGGYAISANSLGLSEVLGAIVLGLNNTAVTTGVLWQYNVSTGKLQAFASNGAAPALLAEVAASTDLSAEKVRVLVLGV
jgi:alpha-D-ribose 1-methylphosphonate 5-phosphate C-P lyase